MGSHVQEDLQRRRDKKGQGIRLGPLKRGVPLLFILVTWLGLLKGLPASKPAFWFPLSLVTGALCYAFYYKVKKEEFGMEFLFSLLLLPAGGIQFFQAGIVRPVYFPLLALAASYFSLTTLLVALGLFALQIPVSLITGMPGIRTFLDMTNPLEEGLFLISLAATAGVSSVLFRKMRMARAEAETSLSAIHEKAREIGRETAMESLSTEESLSHYFASMLRTDEEIGELLVAIKHAVFADSATLFVPESAAFRLRCSTEGKGEVIITGAGAIANCMRDKKTFSAGEVDEKKFKLGYMKTMKVVSVIVVPIMEGTSLIGVLAVDSSRAHAFSEPDRSSIERFAGQLVRILERERIYFMIKRDVFGLRILKEESSNLITSLNRDVIARKLCEGAEKISVSQIFLFAGSGSRFSLLHHNTGRPFPVKLFSFEKTIVNFAVDNQHRHYVRDLREYPIPVMPFETEGIRSVLAIPLMYERTVLGIMVMLSEQVDFLDSLQISLLEVLCNQASTSLANARLHSRIEKLATTDGLTGLFNHRVFQEKFSEELKRQARTAEPVSLLLTDIDFFKKVNDTYGHPVGDLVLKGVSKLISATLRDIDIPARYGGEEFAVILPGTDGPGAKIIAERLRNAVMEKTFSSEEKTFSVTLSIGIAVSPFDAKRKEELIEKADQALYHAKHNGRNQSVLWSMTK
ncbi:MAG: GGDEF domain-containing protein [Nitrospirae bacterium]|nr:MAG: GGDEF domain-containing protein [Nitrospirota bacterium]